MCRHFLFMRAEGRSGCIDISDQIDIIINALSLDTHHLRSQPPNSLSRSSQYPRDLLQLNIYVLFYDNVLRVEERQNLSL